MEGTIMFTMFRRNASRRHKFLPFFIGAMLIILLFGALVVSLGFVGVKQAVGQIVGPAEQAGGIPQAPGAPQAVGAEPAGGTSQAPGAEKELGGALEAGKEAVAAERAKKGIKGSWIYFYWTKGGMVMYPIGLGSLVGMSLLIEKAILAWWTVRRPVHKRGFWDFDLLDTPTFIERVNYDIVHGDWDSATKACEEQKHPMAAIFRAGIEKAKSDIEHTGTVNREELNRTMERVGASQLQTLESRLNALVAVITVEPMLGFLGTIVGLIMAFQVWERLSTNITVEALAAGIYQAMITTAAGLIIAIPFFSVYVVIVNKIKKIAQEMSDAGDYIVDLLVGFGKGIASSASIKEGTSARMAAAGK
jgi:biopolymer transport protein ExbB